jgi:hypothetical protein
MDGGEIRQLVDLSEASKSGAFAIFDHPIPVSCGATRVLYINLARKLDPIVLRICALTPESYPIEFSPTILYLWPETYIVPLDFHRFSTTHHLVYLRPSVPFLSNTTSLIG